MVARTRYCDATARVDDVELDAVQERVVVDRPGVCSAPTEARAIRLARARELFVRDRRERQQLELVDLDGDGPGPVAAAGLHLRTRPQPVRDGDRPVGDEVAELGAELHELECGRRRRRADGLRSEA
jgi:hypothetical protein